MTRIKICCISSVEEAGLAISQGAAALGLVAHMPSGPGVISEEHISEIARYAPPPVATFLLTSEVEPDAIIRQQQRCGTNTIQICDRVGPDVHQRIRQALPGVGIVQVVHVRGEESVDEAVRCSRTADAVLLDSGNQDLQVKELGGTGRVHDWELSARIVQRCEAPVFLAGGLTPANVAGAVARVGPFGLDLCSGVRMGGRLDPDLLSAFMGSVSRANQRSGWLSE